MLAQKHQTAEAERECEKALAIAPSFPAAHMLEASIQVFLREYSAAILSVAAARKGDAHVEWAGIILAGAFNGLHRYEDAMTEVQSLRGDEASSWQAKYEQTRAATGLGDQEEALKLSMELQRVEPKDFPDSILVRANAQLLAHRWSEAAADLTAYLALPGQQTHQEEVRTALVDVTRRMRSVETVNLASK